MSDDTDLVDPPTFREWSAALKRNGCSVLVTGQVREMVSRQMTRKLLGATDVPRTRLLGLTDQDREDAPDLLPGGVGVDDEDVYVVDHDCPTRAVDTAASSGGSTALAAGRDVDDFRTAICDAIATARDADRDFDAAELRVSVFTLSYLASQYEPAAVDRFVSAVGDHVRGVRGMAHFHLPVADDADLVDRLSPQFDVRIELREKRGLPEQRWHFPDRDASTAWVGL